MKIIIIGYGEMFLNLIAGCLDANCEIVGVFRHDRVKNNKVEQFLLDTFNPSKDYNYIKYHNLHEIKAPSVNSATFKKEVIKLKADIVLVGTWSEKLKKPIINLPKIATINAHPALLPRYRGPNPYLQVIKNMEKESGVTFHLMDENFDTGAILHQKKVEILPSDTGESLRNKITKISREGIKELIEKMDSEIIIPAAQDEKVASYYSHVHPDEVMLDFSKSAEEISAQIRGFHPWLKCYIEYKNQFFIPNPKHITIKENVYSEAVAGIIVEKDPNKNSITIVTEDNKMIEFQNIKIYSLFGFINPISKFITKFYIMTRVKLFDKLS